MYKSNPERLKNFIKRKFFHGFMLPMVIITGTVLLIIISFVLRAVSSGRVTITNQHYQLLAKQAAESGIAMAESCVKRDKAVKWSNSKPLRSNTNCNGDIISSTGTNPYVRGDDGSTVRSYFEVKLAPTGPDRESQIHSTGLVEIRSANNLNIISKTFDDTRSAYLLMAADDSSNYVYTDGPLMPDNFNSSCVRVDNPSPGSVACWNRMDAGFEAAPNLYQSTKTAKLVQKNYNWKRISSTHYAACGITNSQDAYCWGLNTLGASWLPDATISGEIGNGRSDREDSSYGNGMYRRPEPVAGNLKWKNIVSGYDHACGLTTSNDIYCWGDASYGQTGLGNNTRTYSPRKIKYPTGVTAWSDVSTGVSHYHTCAISMGEGAKDKNLYCWGRAMVGLASKNTPTKITSTTGVSQWKMVRHSFNGTCALSDEALPQIYCWGTMPLADGVPRMTLIYMPVTTSPVKITNPAGVQYWKEVTTTADLSVCAISNNDQIYCWGENGSGEGGKIPTSQNGFLTTAQQIENPAGVSGWRGVGSLTPGETCAVAISSDPAINKRVYCWGYYTNNWRPTPVKAEFASGTPTVSPTEFIYY